MNHDINDVNEAARGQWPYILSVLGGVDANFLRNKHGPCPLCGGRDRYRFDDKDGSGSYLCSQCGAGYGFHLFERFTGMGFKDAVNAIGNFLHLTPGFRPTNIRRRDPKQEREDKLVIMMYESGSNHSPDDTDRYRQAIERQSPN